MKDLLDYSIPRPVANGEQLLRIADVLKPPKLAVLVLGAISNDNYLGLIALDENNTCLGPVSPAFVTNHDIELWMTHHGIDPKLFPFTCLNLN